MKDILKEYGPFILSVVAAVLIIFFIMIIFMSKSGPMHGLFIEWLHRFM